MNYCVTMIPLHVDDPIALRALPSEASVHLRKFCGYSQTESMTSSSEVLYV